jgi:hypothetical protein
VSDPPIIDDPYQRLNVSEYATERDVTLAYHKLVLEHHPDKHVSSTAAEQLHHEGICVKLNAAKTILLDVTSRRKYDNTRVQPDVVAEPFESTGVQLGSQRKKNTKGLMRRLVDQWFEVIQNLYWKYHPFLGGLGDCAMDRLALFVYNGLPQKERDAPRFRSKLNSTVFRSREKIVMPSVSQGKMGAERGREYGDVSHRNDPVKKKTSDKTYRESPEGQAVIKAYRESPKGQAWIKAHRVRQAQLLSDIRSQHRFAVFGLENTIQQYATGLAEKTFAELGDLTIMEYMRKKGPGQVFLSRATRKDMLDAEAFRLFCGSYKEGQNPPLMWNRKESSIPGLVSWHDVERFGLTKITYSEMLVLGWKYLVLAVVDLTNVEGLSDEEQKRVSRPAFALEQQLQCIAKTLGLDLSELMNRIPGAGAWNSGPGYYFIGFSYGTPEFKMCLGSSIAVVGGKSHWNGKLRCDDKENGDSDDETEFDKEDGDWDDETAFDEENEDSDDVADFDKENEYSDNETDFDKENEDSEDEANMEEAAPEPTTKPAPEPATKPATKPTTKPAPEPATKPATKPTTKPATKPVAKPAATTAPVTLKTAVYCYGKKGPCKDGMKKGDYCPQHANQRQNLPKVKAVLDAYFQQPTQK